MALPQGAPNLELRIVRLEENAYFQEERIKALDDQLLAQQKRLDDLEKLVNGLKARILALEAESDAAKSVTPDDPPPHYHEKI